MHLFERSTAIPQDRKELFEYHANPGAIDRLIPPWEKVCIERRSDSLAIGSEVIIRNSIFGVPVRWHAKHTQLDSPNSFQDVQLSGPFQSWVHDHHFENVNSGNSILHDRIQFEMKFGSLGKLALPIVQSKLDSMFAYRHLTTQADLKLKDFLEPHVFGRKLRIGVTGSTGMIGRRLVDLISVLGHEAVCILRKDSRNELFPLSSSSVVWDPTDGFSDVDAMSNLDAVVHLAGKGIASSRWTQSAKQSIRDSRVAGTTALVRDLCRLQSPPRAFVCASGVGCYGERGDQVVDESQPFGDDFLASLARDWESAAMEFNRCSGNRVAIGRLGIALHPQQGALAKMLLPFRLGLGGPIGNGRQYWSWIHVDDAAAAFLFLAVNPKSEGATNLVAPEQMDNRAFVRTLGHVIHRPAIFPAPAFALRILLGEMADAMLLTSTRADCKRLTEEGFPFRTPKLEACLRHVLGCFRE